MHWNQRPLSPSERLSVQQRNPNFKIQEWVRSLRGLPAAVVEDPSLSVRRVWRYGGCDRDAGCCPEVLLLETEDGSFCRLLLWLEKAPDAVGNIAHVVRLGRSHQLVSVRFEGNETPANRIERQPSIEFDDEACLLQLSDLPTDLREQLPEI